MTTIRSIKSMDRSPSRLALLLIPLVFACFALAQSAQAVGPEADEGDLIGNIAAEDNTVVELGSDTVEAAMAQAANNDNRGVIPFHFEGPLQCAGGKVTLDGKVVAGFELVRPGVVELTSLEFEWFKGTASHNRKLVAKDLRKRGTFVTDKVRKEGTFNFQFKVTGPGLPAGGRALNIEVIYRDNIYTWELGKLKKLIPDKTRTVECLRR